MIRIRFFRGGYTRDSTELDSLVSVTFEVANRNQRSFFAAPLLSKQPFQLSGCFCDLFLEEIHAECFGDAGRFSLTLDVYPHL